MADTINSSQAMAQLVEKMRETKLLIEKNGKSKLDLTAFNRNLKNASANLGTIVPSIVEVSKEQVALVNNGLEGTINFIRAFQTFNTAFAVFVEKPDSFKQYKGKINEIENLEATIINEVRDNLSGLNEMLAETFKEISVYYTALGHIIYSKEEGGEPIEVGYKRSSALKEKMSKIYTRKDELSKGFSMEKSLGLVQIIESLANIDKEIKKVKIDKKTEKTEYYITAKEGEKESKIEVNIDIIEALKGISSNLISSLKSSGVLIEDESKIINVIKQEALEQKYLAQSGQKAVEKIKKNLEEHAKITHFFDKNFSEIKKLETFNAKEKEKAKLYEEISKIKDESEKAKKQHDLIIKNQMDLIIEVVNAFGSIISLWGDQVNNEISIGQVAQKAVHAIDTLSKVQIKSGIETEQLLIAADTQREISKTCAYAEELKSVGKIMKMLLNRVKSLLSYNKGLEAQIRRFHGSQNEAKEYKTQQLKEIKKLLYEKYPGMSSNLSKAIKEFNNKIMHLADSKNIERNEKLIGNLITSYSVIEQSAEKSIKMIKDETEIIDEKRGGKISEFPQSCKRLGLIINETDDKVDLLFDGFRGFRRTFNDDFEIYEKLSKDYSIIANSIMPFLQLMDYIITAQLKLAQQKIDLRLVNQSLKAFIDLFEHNKEIDENIKNTDKDLYNLMKEVGLVGTNYYKKYKEDLIKLGSEKKLFSAGLLTELESIVKNYFEENKQAIEKAYSLATHWVSDFSVNFRTYNQEFKDLKIGFFEKLFKTSSYKEKDFFSELKDVKNSFKEIDNKLEKLSKKNLKEPENVAEFCKFSTEFVNEIFTGYKDLIVEVTKIVEIMSIVNENLSKLTQGKIEKLKNLFETIENLNKKLDENEEKYIDLEEFDRINVSSLLKSLQELSDFNKLKENSSQDFKRLTKSKDSIIGHTENLRNALLAFYTTYLTQVLPKGEEKEEYEKILNQAKAKIK